MELTKCKLGELITQRREKNDGSDLPICGVSKDGLIPPKQKDADTSIYNVFYRDDFIFNPARMELNSIAINDMYDRAICSSLYEVFYVHRTDLLLPHYLKLIIRQKWFTRYCEFLGQGSAREYCRFGNISEIEIEFPPIKEQQKIVDYNTAIENRIALKQKINDNLEATLNTVFVKMYEETDEDSSALLSELCSLASSKRVFAEDYVSDGVPFYRGKEITQKRNGEPISDPLFISHNHFASLKANYGIPVCGDILITAVGTIGNSYFVQDEEFYFKDGNIIWLKDFIEPSLNYYIYDYMQTPIFKRQLEGICIGSTQTALTIVALSNLKVKKPRTAELALYCKKSKALRSAIQTNNGEIERLTQVAKAMLASLSR